jgi:putative glutamine amidotransferase
LDGILFTGGGDLDPGSYRSEPHPSVDGVDPDRDRVELQLFDATVKAGIPFLGVCRGLQLVNVGLGGTLYEDILDQRPEAIRHNYHPHWPRTYLAHPVQIEAGSRLEDILGRPSAQVNSLHHQGIRQLAPGLTPTAHAPDGLIEAVELPEYRFGLAVQWHPEWLPPEAAMDELFEAFTSAASKG